MLTISLQRAAIALLLSSVSLTLAHAQVNITVSPNFPSDVPGGAPNATLQQSAAFAWQEFIALNWPALAGQRDVPDQNQKFGAGGNGSPLVWQTFRSKVEIFNSADGSQNGTPPGYTSTPPDYGYNAPVAYIYRGEPVPACAGQTPPASPSWINLDETTQIGLAQMFAGGPAITSANNTDPQLIRYAVKANGVEYRYIVDPKNQFYKKDLAAAAQNNNFMAFTAAPPRAPTAPFVLFPPGTVEIKSAWRPLTSNDDPTHFHRQTVRFYENKQPPNNAPCYFEEQWGLVALHIIQKTPTAPSFIYATFEQGENIKQPTTGAPVLVEDLDGNIINAIPNAGPTTPAMSYVDAAPPGSPQVTANGGACTPNNALYFKDNPTDKGLTGGISICVNQRYEAIPADVVGVNKAAHAAIAAYNAANQVQNSPWPFYKLVSVQAFPFDVATISKTDPTHLAAVFFQANIVVETNYTLQQFQGRIEQVSSTNINGAPTAFPAPNPTPPPANRAPPPNVFTVGTGAVTGVNMGGCMGCHGNAQVTRGSDFSFIFAEVTRFPETPSALGLEAVKAKYRSLFFAR
jgi:hypothetical protein